MQTQFSYRVAAVVLALAAACAGAETISFDRDIRPILSDNCFLCHGPDPSSRKANLRLDLREEATADRAGKPAIVPNAPDASELIRRITAQDPEDRMPPAAFEKTLSDEQIALLREWIAQGAEWSQHWAFVPPVKPEVPEVARALWVRNPIDAFVLARLEREELEPSPEADPITLLRRLSLDVIGLPPSLDDINRYLARSADFAYADAVERVLASPHFGERMARDWLDAAQFADSDGFEKDKPRQVWAWRDWVINAFNDNMPYDRFVREQIAGDLMPNATQDQIVATGFLRNSMINEEGGIDPEQFRMEAMFNRMDVIGRAVLGLTVQCAQCHTHKYDPLTHREYYGLMAYINNSHEACITVYSDDEQRQREKVLAQLTAIDEGVKQAYPDWREQLKSWEAEVAAMPRPEWHTLELAFDDTSSGGQKFLPREDGSFLAAGYAPTRFHPKMAGSSPVQRVTALRVELLPDPNLPRGGPGRSIYGTCALSDVQLFVAPADQPIETMDAWQRVEIASAIADVNPERAPLGPEFPDPGDRKAFTGPVEYAIDGDHDTAWTIDTGPGRRNEKRYAIFVLKEPIEVSADQQLGVKLIQTHGGWNSDDNQTNNLGRFRLSVTDADALPSEAIPEKILDIVTSDKRSADDEAALFRYWRETREEFAEANAQAEAAWRAHPEGSTQLVYMEREEPRATYLLDRGDFLSPKEQVEPGVPAFLHPLPENAPPNRLGLAAWLTDPNAATTARSFVNRVWQHYFGVGLVETPADLGTQGARPSHPELMDWLAVTFVESGWDVKALHRLIVTSATYRQSSRMTPELLERDSKNRLLARGARFRVDGEVVRDIALAASGLLNPEVGGPSVFPPAPEFLFVPPASYGPKTWKTSEGDAKYRRALYTFRFRSVPYPALQVFDTPPGDAPCVMRNRSNTPLQALTTLNEPVFLECATWLADAALREGGDTDRDRIEYAFRRCMTRAPERGEIDTLTAFLTKQRERLNAGELDPAAILAFDQAEPTSAVERAAWTLAARVILNLDETITRQ